MNSNRCIMSIIKRKITRSNWANRSRCRNWTLEFTSYGWWKSKCEHQTDFPKAITKDGKMSTPKNGVTICTWHQNPICHWEPISHHVNDENQKTYKPTVALVSFGKSTHCKAPIQNPTPILHITFETNCSQFKTDSNILKLGQINIYLTLTKSNHSDVSMNSLNQQTPLEFSPRTCVPSSADNL